MNMIINRAFVVALVACVPLSNANAGVSPVDAAAVDDPPLTAVFAGKPDQPAPLLVAESHGPGAAAPHAMDGGTEHDAMEEGAATAQSMSSAPSQAAIGDLEISAGFTRAMLPGAKVGGGYLTIANSGSKADRLVSVASPAAGHVEIHQMTMEGEIMRMRALNDGLTIAPGETVSLTPGRTHLMFLDVVEPFREGASIAVTLTFERAGPVKVTLPVLGAGATQAEGE